MDDENYPAFTDKTKAAFDYLATYFSNRAPDLDAQAVAMADVRQKLSKSDKESYQRGAAIVKDKCVSCHLDAASGRPLAGIAMIFGQAAAYLNGKKMENGQIGRLRFFRGIPQGSPDYMGLMMPFMLSTFGLHDKDYDDIATYLSATVPELKPELPKTEPPKTEAPPSGQGPGSGATPPEAPAPAPAQRPQ
jgi:mono/diheme cytochrome c family protein